MSALGQKQTLACVVGLSEQHGRYGEPKGLSSLEIDDQLELGRLLDVRTSR